MPVGQIDSVDEDITTANMMLIDVFYQILLFIGDPILLGRFKFGDEVLDRLRK